MFHKKSLSVLTLTFCLMLSTMVYAETAFKDDFERLDFDVWVKSSYACKDWTLKSIYADVEGGNLVLTIPAGKAEGGQIETVKPYTFGRFTAKMKVAGGKGVTTAFFLYFDPSSPDAIDLEIYSNDPTILDVVVWSKGKHDVKNLDLGFDASQDFHVYTIDWQPEKITVVVDEKTVLEYTDKSFIPQRAMYVLCGAYAPTWGGLSETGSKAYFDYVIIDAQPQSSGLPVGSPAIILILVAAVAALGFLVVKKQKR